MDIYQALQKFASGHQIQCGSNRSQSVKFSNNDDMLIIFKSQLTSEEWEIKE